LLKRLCQCIGLASLILVVNYGALLGGGADVRMHVPYRLTAICLAQVVDILLLGLALFAVLAALERTRAFAWVKLLLAIVMPPYLLQRTRTLFPFHFKESLIPALAIVWAAALLVLMLRFPPRYQRLLRMADGASIFLAVFGWCSIVQLLFMMSWKPGLQQINASWAAGPQLSRKHPRLVWIIFDELSHDQLFEHRAQGLALPNFDALRGESTLYTQVQPIGLRTATIVPSLLSGRVVDDLRFSFDNKLAVRYQGTREWRPLDGTVFEDARHLGWRTSVVGWYNPYCTLYGSALDSCYWSNFDRMDGDMAQRDGFWQNVRRPLAQLGTELRSPARAGRESCSFDVRQHARTYRDLDEHASQLVADDQADLLFLHLSIPHSPNIWNRHDNAYAQSCGSSYLDGLALADRELGHMLDLLRSSPRWKDTTLIVQGDHSWRVMLWDDLPAWTDEDEKASHEKFDSRPALMIHNAGQREPESNSSAVSLLNVHDAVEKVLRERLEHP
jgi:hypothetical protein